MESTVNYFRHIDKVWTSKKSVIRFSFDKDRFICKAKIKRVKNLIELNMQVQTGYGYVLDRKNKTINIEQDIDDTVKRYFIEIIKDL